MDKAMENAEFPLLCPVWLADDGGLLLHVLLHVVHLFHVHFLLNDIILDPALRGLGLDLRVTEVPGDGDRDIADGDMNLLLAGEILAGRVGVEVQLAAFVQGRHGLNAYTQLVVEERFRE